MLNTENLFARSELAARLIPHALTIRRLGKIFANTAPPGLVRQARVVNYRQGTVIIHANNGAIAAKLRQISQRLRDAFAGMGLQCNQVDVKVQPIDTTEQPSIRHVKPISQTSAQKILACANAMPSDSSLAASLRQLLERSEIIRREPDESPDA
jgi:hypothetical protein